MRWEFGWQIRSLFVIEIDPTRAVPVERSTKSTARVQIEHDVQFALRWRVRQIARSTLLYLLLETRFELAFLDPRGHLVLGGHEATSAIIGRMATCQKQVQNLAQDLLGSALLEEEL